MIGVFPLGGPRAVALALLTLALAACATAPPRAVNGLPAPPPRASAPAFPFDPSNQPRVADANARLQCVPFARNASGVQIFGNANTWWAQASGRYPQSNLPAVGSVFVMRGYRDASRGHVAVVTRIESERLIRVDHANWLNGGEITVNVPVIDVSPNNDWTQVRVWHVVGGHWGGRIYEAEGFIHPFSLSNAASS
jgi:hypothetical protein